ncbi:neutral zinc metallopeptidase [Paraurantiacibacter namhicola]|uniref:Putative neutral zinc metallopeptidase n=1 Tax=Paraurantiacibacter namhicola TaxID=645517 RepID=A0A1C7D8L3_9SPHN|nr:neutral zinc metallopeptidase [Paraurantiacibacter namhicola]ANU07819.1 Putative neutral zinc metallopeptidase [Paraurantiacibacter namhicola]
MRLNPFNTGDIKVRRGGGGGGFPGGGGGKVGCGTLVIALIGALVFGIDPTQTIGMLEGSGSPTTQSAPAGSSESAAEICDDNQYAMEGCNALASLNRTWQPIFQRAGVQFTQPTLVYYQGGTRSGCGSASSAMGPFYCPADQGIYIDVSFFDQMARQMGAGGDFARYYVMAHEYGHHIQTITGVSGMIRNAQMQDRANANQYQVRLELMADCYAGVWAGANRNLLEPGDMEEGLRAASAIGDDTLMRNAGRRVDAESFTHGTSQQRMQALRLGMQSGGDDTVCDRYVS